LARVTSVSSNHVSDLERKPSWTVSTPWALAACAWLGIALEDYFDAAPPPVRYRVRSALWGILAMRRIDVQMLAAATPNSQQWVSHVYRHPEQTVSEAWARAVSEYLGIPLETIVDPAPLPERTSSLTDSSLVA
jgi:hypothetical protein